MNEFILRIYKYCPFEIVKRCRELSRAWLWGYRKLGAEYFIEKQQLTKLQKLKFFLAFYSYLPQQRSKEWLKERIGDIILKPIMIPPTIGGSEMSSVIGENEKYGGAGKVIAAKLGLDTFSSSIATRWGKLFEPVVRNMNIMRFKTPIYEMGAVPNRKILDPNGYPLVKYSTDGVACVKADVLKKILEEEHAQTNDIDMSCDVIINFEIKCPLTTVPKGVVPEHYQAQPKTGSNTLEIVDMSIFINNMFRKCCVDDFSLENRNFCRTFHKYKIGGNPKPLIGGFVGFYRNKKSEFQYANDNIREKVIKLTNSMRINIEKHITTKSSQFYGLTPTADNMVQFVYLARMICSDKYNTKLNYLAIWNAIRIIYKNQPIEKQIVLNTIRTLDYAGHEFNFTNLDYGTDLGTDCNFEEIMQEWDSDNGIEIYYPENYYFSEDSWGESGNKALDEKTRARVWLWEEIHKFCDFCYTGSHTPIGVLPWKLFICDYILVPNEVGFLDGCQEKINEVVSIVNTIKRKALLAGPYGSKEYFEVCKKEHLARYGQPTAPRAYAKKKSEITKSQISDFQSDLDSFNI
jgi:hypothetical protein